MKLLINTATTYKGGSIQVAQSFISECKAFSQHEYLVVLGLKLAEQLDSNNFPTNFTFIRIPYRPATKVKHFWYQDRFLQKLEYDENPDVVFTTSGPSYWKPMAPHIIGYNLPHYVYRDSPFFSQISIISRLKWRMKGSLIKKYYRRDADLLVGQTNDVSVRAGSWLKTQSVTVSNTCSEVFCSYTKGVPSEKYFIPDGKFRLLTISGYYPHKNLEIIECIANRLEECCIDDIRFVLTISDEELHANFSLCARKYIDNVGSIPNQEAPALYSDCQAMFLPTLLECFSASYPEAMIMQKPIITTSMDFAKSICQDAALYFEPLNAEEAFNCILELKNSEKLQGTLIRSGLKQINKFKSPKERAQAYLEICGQLIE